jgi:hypothetical protein
MPVKKESKKGGDAGLSGLLAALALAGTAAATKMQKSKSKKHGGDAMPLSDFSAKLTGGSDFSEVDAAVNSITGGKKRAKRASSPKRGRKHGGEGDDNVMALNMDQEQEGGKRKTKRASSPKRGRKHGGEGGDELYMPLESQEGGKRKTKRASSPKRGRKHGGADMGALFPSWNANVQMPPAMSAAVQPFAPSMSAAPHGPPATASAQQHMMGGKKKGKGKKKGGDVGDETRITLGNRVFLLQQAAAPAEKEEEEGNWEAEIKYISNESDAATTTDGTEGGKGKKGKKGSKGKKHRMKGGGEEEIGMLAGGGEKAQLGGKLASLLKTLRRLK